MPWHISEGEPLWIDPANTGRMSSQQLAEYSRQQQARVINDNDPRGTGVGVDGLFLHETLDGANRPVREFSLPAGATKMSTWLAPFVTSPQRAMVWAGNGKSVKDMTAIKRRILAEERQLAEKGLGSFPEFDIERDKSRVRAEVGD